jgi:hypothetical protein
MLAIILARRLGGPLTADTIAGKFEISVRTWRRPAESHSHPTRIWRNDHGL